MLTELDLFDITARKHGGNPESAAANRAAAPTKHQQRERIFAHIRLQGEKGATCDEVAIYLGTTPNAISGRFTELKRANRIIKRGTRPTRSGCAAAVYFTEIGS